MELSAQYQITAKPFIKLSRAFYAITIIVYGLLQFIYGNFSLLQLPPWQYNIPALNIIAYITGAGLIIAGAAIIFGKNAREASLILGGVFLILVCFVHIPYELISEPNKSYHLGLWENALGELALCGGAFVVAGSFPKPVLKTGQKKSLIKFLEKIIPFGNFFFCITITCYGIGHFMYIQFIKEMVPAWFPDHIFWAYFAGVALISSGVCIVLDIQRKKIAFLLGTMIFIWFIILHAPSAFANPVIDRSNEILSAFDALAFSGIAFLIAFENWNAKNSC